MKKWKQFGFSVCVVMVMILVFALTVVGGGPPLKENPCGVCHKDYKVLMPKTHPDMGSAAAKSCLDCHAPDPARAEANKFSTAVHKAHKEGGKTTLECGACHAL